LLVYVVIMSIWCLSDIHVRDTLGLQVRARLGRNFRSANSDLETAPKSITLLYLLGYKAKCLTTASTTVTFDIFHWSI